MPLDESALNKLRALSLISYASKERWLKYDQLMPKLRLTTVRQVEDLIIENQQCYRRAEIHTQVIGGLMDARASIVSHNLNQLIKKFTIWTVAIMLANLVIGIFSMNVSLPLPMDKDMWPFWFIIILSLASSGLVFWLWRHKKW